MQSKKKKKETPQLSKSAVERWKAERHMKGMMANVEGKLFLATFKDRECSAEKRRGNNCAGGGGEGAGWGGADREGNERRWSERLSVRAEEGKE